MASGFGLEVVLTLIFVWVICAVALDHRGPGFLIAPIAIGLTLTVVHLVGIPFTSVSVNLTRTFGPTLVTGNWNAHWIYWVGPLLGATIAAFSYGWFFGEKD